MRFWNPTHPEADLPRVRALVWRQAAELASLEPTTAARLLAAYEAAVTFAAALHAALDLEAARAEAAGCLRLVAARIRHSL